MKNKIVLIILLSCVFLFTFLSTRAQEKYNYTTSVQVSYNNNMIHRPSIKHFAVKHFYNWQFSVGRSLGKGLEDGFTISYSTLGRASFLGNMYGCYYYIVSPLIGKSIYFKSGLGLGYNSKVFNYQTNFENVALGTAINILVNVGLAYKIQLAKKHILQTSLELLHFSNGATRTPNLGLNIIGLHLRYSFTLDKEHEKKQYPIEKHKWKMRIGIGKKQNNPALGNNYFVSLFSLNRTLLQKNNYVICAFTDIGFNSAIMQYKSNALAQWQQALGVEYEPFFNRLSFPVSLAFYGFDVYRNGNFMYQKIAVNYRLNSNLNLSACLKTHYAKADFLTIGIQSKL
jgi:hypothetical protein